MKGYLKYMKRKMITQMRELLDAFEIIIVEDEKAFETLSNEINKLQSICDNQESKLYYLEDELDQQKQKNQKIAQILMED